MNVAMGDLSNQFLWEIFLDKTRGCGDGQKFLQWLQKCVPIEFRDEQKQRMKDSPEMKAASFLMHLVRQDHLKKLREYGSYENSKFGFSRESIERVIDLAQQVRRILMRSPELVTSEPMGVAGVNMPENEILPLKTG